MSDVLKKLETVGSVLPEEMLLTGTVPLDEYSIVDGMPLCSLVAKGDDILVPTGKEFVE